MAMFKEITWLEAHGKIRQHMLSSTLTYDVLFELLIKPYVTGFIKPTTFALTFPKAAKVVIKENLESRPRSIWFTIKVGEIKVEDKHDCDSDKEYEFSMYNHSEDRKSGLIFKGIHIRPKQPSYGSSS
ncbi:protein PHLOEM PROTEIN 2-LIKE A1-like [Cucumis melo var. makuwa]|uniref:Lectin-like n=2 Tax=Cucumis melo TaxID=3656 RepID=A0A1S3CPT4_CUCME|nr:lectin-like [Cucumis melo]KAA0047061.1 protein PHLOEM PROTEIN 2-LIKE A1-like [Cucumis melo var. makuwa]TYK05096.1 protein PHLOEM PROTEIN 2-LIKE A1-like [Cucumis melo var. makuwa]